MPSYCLSILLALVLPTAFLIVRLRQELEPRAFLRGVGVVTMLGWSWSSVVSAHGWWRFAPEALTGVWFGPYLPIEEMLFYPSGGALCILLYQLFSRPPDARPRSAAVWYLYTTLGTLFFAAVAWERRDFGPWYLCSQLVLYNLALVLPMAPVVARQVDVRALLRATAIMSLLGYVWDHLAFTYGWWNYIAVTGWRIGRVPFDDFDFFAFAPAAAISLYLVLEPATSRAARSSRASSDVRREEVSMALDS